MTRVFESVDGLALALSDNAFGTVRLLPKGATGVRDLWSVYERGHLDGDYDTDADGLVEQDSAWALVAEVKGKEGDGYVGLFLYPTRMRERARAYFGLE